MVLLRLAPLLLLTLAGGCASAGGTIVLQPHDGSMALTQEFRQALVSRSEHGEYYIVLLDTPSHAPRKPKKHQPLVSTPIEPIQQVVLIHLHWTPMAGTKDNPAAINASLNWYILGSEAANDIMVYDGAGFVTFSGESVQIRAGTLTPVLQRGAFRDPLGPCDITGIATVVRSDGRVRDMIAQMRNASGRQ